MLKVCIPTVSAEFLHPNPPMLGVSLLTQMLYAVVFVTRYLDLTRANGWSSVYNVFFKLFYIISSFYIIYIMMKVFPRTRERERAWKLGIGSAAVSLVLAPILTLISYGGFPSHWFTEVSRPACKVPYLVRNLGYTDRLRHLDLLGVFHCSGIRLCVAAAVTAAADHRPHGH